MKRGVVVLAMLAMLAVPVFGQMSDSDRQEFEQFKKWQKMNGTVQPTVTETVSKYAGLGKEIGQAMREAVQSFDQGLTVTEEHVYKFLNTTTGKLTMAIIVWKVLGKSIVSLSVAIAMTIFLIIWIRYWIKMYFYGKMVLDTRTGPWYNRVRTYKRLAPLNTYPNRDNYAAIAIFGSIPMIVALLISVCSIA